MYLTAIIDVASRFIVGWALSNTLEARICTEILAEAIAIYGKPKIINSDQGSMAKDNIWIERFWKTIKQEHIYLNPADDGLELYFEIKEYISFYNYKRAHQGIGRIRPVEKYENSA